MSNEAMKHPDTIRDEARAATRAEAAALVPQGRYHVHATTSLSHEVLVLGRYATRVEAQIHISRIGRSSHAQVYETLSIFDTELGAESPKPVDEPARKGFASPFRDALAPKPGPEAA
jgi:hypothetical protein